MTVWDSTPDRPEDEVEEEGWHESDDDQADGWKGEPDGEDDPFDPDSWRYGEMGPEERMHRDKLDDSDDCA